MFASLTVPVGDDSDEEEDNQPNCHYQIDITKNPPIIYPSQPMDIMYPSQPLNIMSPSQPLDILSPSQPLNILSPSLPSSQ